RYVEAVLAAHDLGQHFTELVTVDRDAGVPEKAAVLRVYRARHAVDVSRFLMVGDRASDVEAARAVGCRFIGCDYGHGHADEIAGAGPVVSAFDQLPDVIATLLWPAEPSAPAGSAS